MSTFKKYVHHSALAFVAFFSLTGYVHAASFDCTKAGTAIEKQICNDGYLNGLDDVLGSNYKKMMASNIGSGAQENLRLTQRQWLTSRNRCQDRQCLVNAYKVRIEQICDYPVITGRHPGCGTPEDYKHLDAGGLVASTPSLADGITSSNNAQLYYEIGICTQSMLLLGKRSDQWQLSAQDWGYVRDKGSRLSPVDDAAKGVMKRLCPNGINEACASKFPENAKAYFSGIGAVIESFNSSGHNKLIKTGTGTNPLVQNNIMKTYCDKF